MTARPVSYLVAPDTKQIIVPTLVVTRADADAFSRRVHTLRGQ